MAKPAFIRYLPARLKPLGNPAVWIPLTVVALAGAFAWEYSRNPDWFGREPITSLAPNSRLTPEEQARLSEIDTLDVLLDGSRVPEGTEQVTSQINPDAPITEEEEGAVDDEDAAEGNALEDLPIPGAATATRGSLIPEESSVYSDSDGPRLQTAQGSDTTQFNFGDGLVNPAAPATNSALAEALNRREAARAAIEQGEEQQNSTTLTPASGSSIDFSEQPTPSAPVVPGQAVVPAGNGIPGPFIRTTPEMSPPAGTTGYRAPASSSLPTFNIPPQQPTQPLLNRPNTTDQFRGSPGIQTPRVQSFPGPATFVTPDIGESIRQSSAGNPSPSGSYTAPTSVQPAQARPTNPRR